MKIVSLLGILLFFGHAHAQDKSSGCGLGWKVTGRKSLLSSYIRSATNSTTSSTLGMTSGTSGCEYHSIVKNEKKDVHFAEANFHSLMIEMAKGQGEYVTGFALVMGCADNQTSEFSQAAQRNYDQLFPQRGTDPSQLVNDMKSAMTAEGVCQATI